jgi:2-succinyl-6-hydroxy-2,4-cyclohexadiene-1-carboxylate synthase
MVSGMSGGLTDAGLALRVTPGDGPGVLWVHGYTLDSTVWAALWERLPGWRHLGVDLPGHGASRPLADDESLAGLGAELVRVAVDQGARHLVGLSFGSTVALAAAIAAPTAFSSLVLAAPAVAGAPTDPEAQVRYLQLQALYRRYGPGPHMAELWMSSPPDIFAGAAARPALWRELRAVIERHTWRELAGRAMWSLALGRQHPAELRRIGADTLVLLGERDMPAQRQSAELLADLIVRSRVEVVPDAGHLCLLEAPAAVAPSIDAHLRQGRLALRRPSS